MTIEELTNIICLYDTIPPRSAAEKELLHLATHMQHIIYAAVTGSPPLDIALLNASQPFYTERTER